MRKKKGPSKSFVPNGLSAPALGYMHVKKKKKIKSGKKSDFKEFFFLRLATNGQSDKEFLLSSTFCPKRDFCP